ncbi:HEPN domain-containing protein [bacterium]|nr:HEPN domain-containing protein [bacterium]MBU2599364.1 HEPN domain-containing protein [bacterium]
MNPSKKRRLLVLPEEWLKSALSDLKLGKLGKENGDILEEQICFHTQQAAEKALKSILLFCKIDFPLTHDIEELLDILSEAGITLPQDIMDAGILTPYAVETRYPGYWEEITEENVDEAIKLAEKAVKWAEKYMAKTTEITEEEIR